MLEEVRRIVYGSLVRGIHNEFWVEECYLIPYVNGLKTFIGLFYDKKTTQDLTRIKII